MTLRKQIGMSLAALLVVACTPQEQIIVDKDPVAPAVGNCGVSTGIVDVSLYDGWEALLSPAAIRSGNTVQTAAFSSTRIDLNSGVVVRIQPESQTTFLSKNSTGEPILRQKKGVAMILLNVGVAGLPAPKLLVQTAQEAPFVLESKSIEEPTLIRLTALNDITEIAVMQGVLAINGVVLKKGYFVTVDAKQISAKDTLMGAPKLTSPLADQRYFCTGLWLSLAWSALDTADSYHVRISPEMDLQTPIWTQETKHVQSVFAPQHAGTYVWSAAARDASGRLGEFAKGIPFFCEEQPPQELLKTPVDGDTKPLAKQVKFEWTAAFDATQYLFVWSTSRDLNDGFAHILKTKEPSIVVSDLPVGSVYWGVYTDEAIPHPLFLKPFEYKQVGKAAEPVLDIKTPGQIGNWGN